MVSIFFYVNTLSIPNVGVETAAKKFNTSEWKKADKDSNIKHQMFDDLSKNYLKSGISKDAIITLLGKPDSKRCGGVDIVKNDTILSYQVSRGLDVCSLDIYLNSLNKLASFEICCN